MDMFVLEPERWKLIFSLLSLDGIVPLYEVMGLHLPDKQKFLQLLRSLISKSRELHGSDPVPAYSLATQVMQKIEGTLGKPTADHFYKWATTVFFWTHEDQPQWSAWDVILLYENALSQEARLSPEKKSAIMRFHQANETDDVERDIVKLKSQPLSKWDSETYSINSFDNKDDPMCEDDYIDPYSIILSTVEMNRFQLGWEGLMNQFSDNEKTRLWDYGKQMLEKEGIEIPKTLNHPDHLHRQI